MYNKIAGAIFGAAAGDAVGCSFEGMSADEKRVPEISGGGIFSLPAGSVTDDTYMTIALAETYLEYKKFDRDRFLKKVTLAIRSYGKTFGRTTKTISALSEQGCFSDLASDAVNKIFECETNGSVMRTIPVGLVPCDTENEARRVSAFTHSGKEACDASAAVSSAAHQLLMGASKSEILSAIPEKYLSCELIPSVSALESTACAFDCFFKGSDYVDVIRRAICLGGDTDTIGAIAGGLAGIFYGYESIPKKWIDSIIIKNELEEISKGLTLAHCASQQV
ncbi:MAG: ADP-ribosylglycohydrolase family protein [Methanocorpusculum sp.]|nr:ADP-ribosylglycohydrolase family protein [Methanocorpusculum sp.]